MPPSRWKTDKNIVQSLGLLAVNKYIYIEHFRKGIVSREKYDYKECEGLLYPFIKDCQLEIHLSNSQSVFV